MNEALMRIALLIGEENVEKLKDSTVMIVGIGGVGSYSVESLARCGVGHLILVDGDTIAESNLNRQLHATYSTIGEDKVIAMENRIHEYAPDCKVTKYKMLYDKTQNELLFSNKIDFVIDAIDTISCKADLIESCIQRKIPFISCLGMANRFDPTKIQIMDLFETSYDPLAKVLRSIIRKRNLNCKIPVVCSSEKAYVQRTIVDDTKTTRKEKMPPASTPFVPSAAGLTCASYAVKYLLNENTVNEIYMEVNDNCEELLNNLTLDYTKENSLIKIIYDTKEIKLYSLLSYLSENITDLHIYFKDKKDYYVLKYLKYEMNKNITFEKMK